MKRPGQAFGRAFDDPAHGFLYPVDLDVAQREHDAFVELLAGLGPVVHVLEDEPATDPDLVYTFDPLLVTDRGAIPLRPGKPNRADEPGVLEAWTTAAGIPTAGRIEAPGTIEGGDTLWLRPDLFCIGRTLRTEPGGGGPAVRAGRRRRARLRCPVLEGARRAHPLDERHLARVRRPRGRVPAAPAGRPVAAARRPRDPARRGAGRRVPDAGLQRAGRRGPGSSSLPRAIRSRRRPSRPQAATCTPIPRPRSGSTGPAVRPA